MRSGDLGPDLAAATASSTPDPHRRSGAQSTGEVIIETTVSPFHCLYQDALFCHSQSQRKLAQSESEASRLVRAAFLLYLDAIEALVHQAAVELGRVELAATLVDPDRPLPLGQAWRLLPAIVVEGDGCTGDLDAPPWPQFAELLALRTAWTYPGPASDRAAFYRAERQGAPYEPLEPHRTPSGLGLGSERLAFPRTGLPRDPYALRPRHLDTARGVVDSAIETLDRRLGGALTRGGRHRREPVRVVYP